MVNLSLNWATISGLLLMALWVPALVVSLRRFDLLMDRDQSRATLQGFAFVWFLITLAGRCIAMPLVGSILFFQGWRLDAILQFGLGLLVLGTIVESIPSIRADHRALQQRTAKDDQLSSRQRALVRRLNDRVWPWSFAHWLLPFAGIYYAITRRTLTPLLWDVTARVAVALLTAGLMALTSVLFPIDTERVMANDLTDADIVNSWILGIIGLFLVLVNLVAAVLPVRLAIRRTQADARRRLADVN